MIESATSCGRVYCCEVSCDGVSTTTAPRLAIKGEAAAAATAAALVAICELLTITDPVESCIGAIVVVLLFKSSCAACNACCLSTEAVVVEFEACADPVSSPAAVAPVEDNNGITPGTLLEAIS